MNVGFSVSEPERTLFAVLIRLISPPDSILGGLWTLSSMRDWEITLYLQLSPNCCWLRQIPRMENCHFERYIFVFGTHPDFSVSCYPTLLLKVQVIFLIPANCHVYVRLPFPSPCTHVRQFALSNHPHRFFFFFCPASKGMSSLELVYLDLCVCLVAFEGF